MNHAPRRSPRRCTLLPLVAPVVAAAGLAVSLLSACGDGTPTLPVLRGDTAASVDPAIGTYGLRSVDSVPPPVVTTEELAGGTRTTELLADTLFLAADGQYRQNIVTRTTERRDGTTGAPATGTTQTTGRWARVDTLVTLVGFPINGVPQDTARGPLTPAGRLTLRRGTSVRIYQR